MKAVGVDIDGVLGDQVTEVIRRANSKYGLHLTYEDVTHWNLEIGDSSFVPLIREAMRDPEYVLEMPVHDDAAEMLRVLSARYRLRIITVRPEEAMTYTKTWLDTNGLVYDDLMQASEATKSRHAVDALVDDFPRNLHEYLTNSNGVGILVQQPWNQDLTELAPWGQTTRLAVARSLAEVPELVTDMLSG